MTLNRPKRAAQSFTAEQVMEALDRFRVTEGVDDEAIAAAVAAVNEDKQGGGGRVLIAKGRPPLPSEDARFDYPVLSRLEKRDTDPYRNRPGTHIRCEPVLVRRTIASRTKGVYDPE